MIRKALLLGFFFLGYYTSVYSQKQVLSSDTILKRAYRSATLENKKVFIIFHASWCGWCHKMDSSLNDKACKQFFDNNYIIRHLVVYESKANKHLENPGAEEMLLKYKGKDQGIPFWLIFDKNGKLLADSQIRAEGEGLDVKGQNTGCPAEADEVKYFISVLRKTSTITESQLQVIEKRFRENVE